MRDSYCLFPFFAKFSHKRRPLNLFNETINTIVLVIEPNKLIVTKEKISTILGNVLK